MNDDGHQPVRRVRRSPLVHLAVALGVVSTLFLVYDVVWQNQPLHRQDHWPELLDQGTAANFVLAAIAGVIGGKFAEARVPWLSYRSLWVDRPERLPSMPDEDGVYRSVYLSNGGNAIGFLATVSWHVEAASGAVRDGSSVTSLRQELERYGLVEGTDYWVADLSPGYPFWPASPQLYFECSRRVHDVLRVLRVRIWYDSWAGDRYEKRVVLLSAAPVSRSIQRKQAVG